MSDVLSKSLNTQSECIQFRAAAAAAVHDPEMPGGTREVFWASVGATSRVNYLISTHRSKATAAISQPPHGGVNEGFPPLAVRLGRGVVGVVVVR